MSESMENNDGHRAPEPALRSMVRELRLTFDRRRSMKAIYDNTGAKSCLLRKSTMVYRDLTLGSLGL